jgi:hypothetical protein
MLRLTIIVLCSLFTSILLAQSTSIETDRPSYSNTPFTVSQRMFQVETGFSRTVTWFGRPYKDLDLQHPSLLVKYGVAKNIELRLMSVYESTKNIVSNGTFKQHYIPYIQIGAKYNFLQQKGIVPKTSLIINYVYNGLQKWRRKKDTIQGFNFKLVFQNEVASYFVIRYSGGLQWDDFINRNPKITYCISPTIYFDEKWRGYIELFGFARKNFVPINSIGTGIIYAINDNLKLDVTTSFNINKKKPYKPAEDMSYGFGVSYRIPTKN